VVAAWLGFAHLSLLAAAVLIALDAELLAATFYHPRLLAAVHLLAIGWISGSILGALYMVPSMALRVRLPRHFADLIAFAVFASGVVGIAVSFWLWRPLGIAVSGVAVIAGAAWVAARVLPALRQSPAASAARAAFATGFGGLLLASLLGMAAAASRGRLPAPQLAITFAHAHLAMLGWALPIVIGAGYRLLPMLLPAAMPSPRRMVAALSVTAGAALLLPAGLLSSSQPVVVTGAAAGLASVVLVVRDVGWMLRHPRPVPPARPRPDLPLGHVAAAFACLLAAATCGLVILGGYAPPGLRAAYGILALLGFLGQLIAGVVQRLVAWLCWLHAYTADEYRSVPPSPYSFVPRGAQRLGLGLWLAAVPSLALGAATGEAWAVRCGALALALAAGVGASGLLRAALLAAKTGAGAGRV
jgi:hypothetical protein